jgi:hypothetical protein
MTTASAELLARGYQADNSLRHGHARHGPNGQRSPTYRSWCAMLTRCRNPRRHNAENYSGRGIQVCERWESFENFLADMGERPDGRTLERDDTNKGYEPGNCSWATPIKQARNRRNAKLTFETAKAVAGRMLRGEAAAKVAAEFGISESLPREILKGRTWKDALAAAKVEFDNG